SSFILGTTNWESIDVPPHLSALGLAMYAFGGLDLPTGKLEIRADASMSTIDELERELATIRRKGFAVTRGHLEEGLDAVAAPVIGEGDVVHAAIGVSGPSFRFGEAHDEIGELLVTEANRLGRALGRHPGKRSS